MTDSNLNPNLDPDSQPGLFYDDDDIVFQNIRHANNYGHQSVVPKYLDEMPRPSWGAPGGGNGKGWFYMNNSGNSKDKYSKNAFHDFNYQNCTGGSDNYKYKWLLGSSEHSGGSGKPPEFGRSNWSMHDCDKGNDPGANGKKMWYNDGTTRFTAINRSSCNLSRKYYWGLLDSHKFNGSNYVKYDHSKNAKANYIRAKGITFRYSVYHEETTKSIPVQNDMHGIVPIRWAALAFVGPNDDYIYLAELISNDKNESDDSDTDAYCQYPIAWNDSRQQRGQWRFHTDWNITVTTADGKIEEVLGGGPWDEFGAYAGKNYGYNKPYGSKNFGTNWDNHADGCASMTLSMAAVGAVWERKMVCVGILIGSSNTSRRCGFVGSTMNFKMWDVKLLEAEHRNDTSLPDKTSESAVRFSSILRAPMTVKETHQYLSDIKIARGEVYSDLNWINSKNP